MFWLDKLKKYSELQKQLLLLECELGIEKLSYHERVLLASIVDSQMGDGSFESDTLKAHDMNSKFSNATFFRTLRSLQEKGYIAKITGRRRGTYTVIDKPTKEF